VVFHITILLFYGFYRWGGLTSLAGLLTSVLGKGKLRWPSCGVSALMIFLWFAAAMGE
jgi:hypothetical protein